MIQLDTRTQLPSFLSALQCLHWQSQAESVLADSIVVTERASVQASEVYEFHVIAHTCHTYNRLCDNQALDRKPCQRPLACAFRRQGRNGEQKAEDMRQRPAWVQSGKCAAHPWRPLQWDHVSQAQLNAFETGLRASQSSPSATALNQQPSGQCRMVAWEDEEQSQARLRQAASHQGQKHQLSHRQLSTTPGSCAALREQPWTGRGQANHAVPSKYRAPLASSAHCTSLLQPAMQHSVQGYGAQHHERQPCKAAIFSPCQQTSDGSSAKESTRGLFRHDSAGRKHRAAATPYPSKAKGDTGRCGRNRGDKSSPCKAGTPPSPIQLGKSLDCCKVSPDRAGSPSKGHKEAVTESRTQNAALHHDGKQADQEQKGQQKPSLSLSPTQMSNWIRWEACDQVMRPF